MAFSPDGTLLAIGAVGGVRIVNTSTWTVTRGLDRRSDGLRRWLLAGRHPGDHAGHEQFDHAHHQPSVCALRYQHHRAALGRAERRLCARRLTRRHHLRGRARRGHHRVRDRAGLQPHLDRVLHAHDADRHLRWVGRRIGGVLSERQLAGGGGRRRLAAVLDCAAQRRAASARHQRADRHGQRPHGEDFVAFSPSTSELAIGTGFSGSATTYSTTTRTKVGVEQDSSYDIVSLGYSPNGKYIIGGELDCGCMFLCQH